MLKIHIFLFFMYLLNSNSTLIDFPALQNNILSWKTQNLLNFSEVGAGGNGGFDISDVKNKILQWKSQKLASLCPSNGPQLQNILNIVCSTAQATNVTLRDACIACFSRVTAMSEGPQELNALSTCAIQFFTEGLYADCAKALMVLSSSALNVQPSGCFMGYCDFVRCLRSANSVNLITQCTREARTGINITVDADNVRFYKNVTSCILAKSRCTSFNPITGEPQIPGYLSTGVRISNALQIADSGELRVIAFSANTPVSKSFCALSSNLTQTSWLTNVC